MSWEVFETFSFFFPQLMLGIVLGALLSLFGAFLVLRNMAFFGVALSQVVTSGVAVSLFLGIEGEWFAVFVSLVILAPLISINQRDRKHSDTLLGVLFVFFASFSQFLLSLGGNVKNQIMAAFFGDILTNQVKSSDLHFLLLFISFVLFIIFFRKFLFLSFDRDEFRVRGYSAIFYDLIFHGIAVLLLSISVHLLGSFYATAHLLIPAYTGLVFVRSVKGLLIFGVCISVMSTLLGFSISLIGIDYNNEIVYFPTSSTIVVVLAILGLFLRLLKRS
ncbi:metal ABC transporter permease [Leptospira sp. GIMC2001]|uniref:metal ABC transporter permease n=1 Tax=Leptospira sp. GIMC2001 TaxID=1513297 RepID=UPI0004A5C3CE|nr:metal ABC transporter permease [Leptospira sp. GIMC2001]AID56184.1 zinc ABC transporter inner membrane permease protein ZnuB [Leptospira sp. GIMC2001]WCL48355.1 metal ABC transporter permease [Leptospira sp. GIMC2001]